MCTQTIIRLSSLRCRALILMQPGLPPVTSCPFSVRRWSHRKRDRVGTWMGRQRKGLWAEKELEERLKERGVDRRKTALTHMLLIRGGRGEWETGVLKLLSSLSVSMPGYCLCTAMADIWVFGRDDRRSVIKPQRLEATHQCLADETRFAQRRQMNGKIKTCIVFS